MREEKVVIGGTVENIVYHNDRNDYTVLELTGDDGSMITAVGTLPFVTEGEELVLYGRFAQHKTYGEQLVVDTYEKRLPSDVHAILRYLSSRTVRGISPATAAKIVSRYGAESFDVIEHHPEWLADIPGISAKKAAEISEAFREQTGVRSVMMFCRDFFGAATATRVYKRFGAGAVGMIRENPYCLCENDFGIGFEKADEIAAALGFSKDSALRITAGISYLLRYQASANGHACLPEDKLIPLAAESLGVDPALVKAALTAALRCGLLVLYAVRQESGERRYIFEKNTAAAEAFVAEKLCRLDANLPTYGREDIALLIARAEKEQGVSYANLQKKAILSALSDGVLIVTGGPGTGKTTLVRALLHIFEHLGHHVALCAPTGRAAKRMSLAAAHEATTIHRLLEAERAAEGEGVHFRRNASTPLNEDVIIVDEASMLDIFLMRALLLAVKNGSRIILIGDVDQLPSVGGGNLLSDLIDSARFSTVRLTEVFRQSEESLIVTNAHRINRGEMPELDMRDRDFFFLERTEEQIAQTVVSLITTRLPRTYGKEIVENIQVISPSRKGHAGTEALNRLLQEKLNPASSEAAEISFRNAVFRVGDRVMQVRNNYEIKWKRKDAEGHGVFNGDVGVIESIDRKEEEMLVRYDDRVASYDFTMLEELEHAYAITVHKSQGSEYPVVILPLYTCAPQLLTRNMIYTAVTRARRMVIFVGRRDVAARMVENNYHVMRYTCLAHRLSGGGEG